MPDKEPGNKHLVNLHGIRFHITGDPTSEEAKKRIHAAKLDVGQLKITHPVPISRLERPGKYTIRGTHGRYEVSMTIPEVVEKIVEEKKVRKVKEEGYVFVPAIMIGTEEEILNDAWSPQSYYFRGERDVLVCGNVDWEGQTLIVEDVPTPNEFSYRPGHTFCLPEQVGRWIDVNPSTQVKPLTDWGNRGLYIDFDWGDSVSSSDEGSFSPGPAIPYEYAGYGYGVAYAVALNRLVAIRSPVYYGQGYDDDYDPAYKAAAEYCDDEQLAEWRCWDLHHKDGWSYDFCCAHGCAPGDHACDCFYRHWTNTGYLLWADQCVGQWFWFAYKVERWKILIYTPEMWAFMGFCYAGSNHVVEEFISEMMWDEEVGGPQTRSGFDNSSTDYWGLAYNWEGYSDWSSVRSGGNINWEREEYGDYSNRTQYAQLVTMCTKSQDDTHKSGEIYPYGTGDYQGAYIQDVNAGDETYVCPIEDFRNLYFLLITEYHYYFEWARTSPGWGVSGMGYSAGVWQDGTLSIVSGSVADEDISRYEQFYVLAVLLNGERIEIDRSDDYGGPKSMRPDQFHGLDSHIFDFNGTPVYMYSYVRVKYEGGDWTAMYTRYGYFLNGKHYQSEKFEPAGITEGGDLYGLHDVAGSSEKETPKYGFGQCAAFIVKHTFEREVPV